MNRNVDMGISVFILNKNIFQAQKSDPVARKLRLRRRNRDGPGGDPDEKQAQVLKGKFNCSFCNHT